MIPFAALACLLESADGAALEISMMDLSALGFTFRAPHRWSRSIASGMRRVTLTAHRASGDESCVLGAEQLSLTAEEETESWVLWRLETGDAASRALLRRYMDDFNRYTVFKQAENDAAMAQAEPVTGTSFSAQRTGWLNGLTTDADWFSAARMAPEWAVALNEPRQWARFLALDAADFTAWYWADHGLAAHPLAARPFNGVYIGSQVCPLLRPEEEQLRQLLAHASQQGMHPVLALAPVREGCVDETLALAARAAEWMAEPLEIVVNDLGTARLLKDCPGIRLTAGILLLKRRKDVRLNSMLVPGGQSWLLSQTPAADDAWQHWLLREGIGRLSAEACGMEAQPPAMRSALHLPFYQMATAGRCTLAARCEAGDRALQAPRAACPGWCAERAFLYPDALQMVGRYNSLFGLDARSLTDGAYLRSLMGQLTDRLVIDLM